MAVMVRITDNAADSSIFGTFCTIAPFTDKRAFHLSPMAELIGIPSRMAVQSAAHSPRNR